MVEFVEIIAQGENNFFNKNIYWMISDARAPSLVRGGPLLQKRKKGNRKKFKNWFGVEGTCVWVPWNNGGYSSLEKWMMEELSNL